MDEGIDISGNASGVVAPDGYVLGILWFEDYHGFEQGEEPDVDEVMQRLEPNELLSSTTTILDAVEIFGSRPNKYFYVIHINTVVGIIFYRDLFKPLGRLAFLALALEIEDQALRPSITSVGCQFPTTGGARPSSCLRADTNVSQVWRVTLNKTAGHVSGSKSGMFRNCATDRVHQSR